VKEYRRKRRKGKNKRGEHPGSTLRDEPGEPNNRDPHSMSAAQRGICRQLWAGGVVTGQRFYEAGMITSSACPHCGAPNETTEHAAWECPEFDEERRPLFERYTRTEIRELPEATRDCGIVLDDYRLDDYFSSVALEGDLEEAHPPTNDDSDEMSQDSEGYDIVAGDGAAPNGQSDDDCYEVGSLGVEPHGIRR